MPTYFNCIEKEDSQFYTSSKNSAEISVGIVEQIL